MIKHIKILFLIPLLVLTTGFFAQYVNIEVTTPYIEEITTSFYYQNDTITGIGTRFDTNQLNNGSSSIQFIKFDQNYSSFSNILINDSLNYQYIFNTSQINNYFYCAGIKRKTKFADTTFANLCKISSSGHLIWSKTYTDSLISNYLTFAIPVNDTCLIISGNAVYNSNNIVFTSLVDTAGNSIWQQFDSVPNAGLSRLNLFYKNGKIYQSFMYDGVNTYTIIKCKNVFTSNTIWSNNYSNINDQIIFYISQMPDGSLLGTGDYKADSAFPYKPYLIHLDTAGNTLYDTVIQNNYSTYNSVLGLFYHPTVLFDTTAFYVVGTKSYPNYGAVMVLYKIDYNFNILWQREYESGRPNAGNTNIYAIFKKDTNNILMAGIKSAETGYNTNDVWFMEVDTNGCIIPNCTVGINEFTYTPSISIAPNPTDNAITITLNDEVTADEIRITDIQGRVIYNSRISTSKIYFEFYHYEQGIYLVQLFNKGIPLNTSKVVVSK